MNETPYSRACISCRGCFRDHETVVLYLDPRKEADISLIRAHSQSRDAARSDARMAVQEILNQVGHDPTLYDALSACKDCNYRSPAIAELFERQLPEMEF